MNCLFRCNESTKEEKKSIHDPLGWNPPGYAWSLLALGIGSHLIFCKTTSLSFLSTSYIQSIFGFIVGFGGLWIAISSKKKFQSLGIKLPPCAKPKGIIVKDGWFAYSRNPMYVGITGFLLGAGIFFGSIPTLFPPFIFLYIINKWFIPYEEKNLEKEIGEEYIRYKEKTPRWVGFV